jgi:phosphoglycerate-specific signal transduction histidine kinase
MTLGEELAKASDGILELILNSTELERMKALRAQLTAILKLTAQLVEANVRKDTEEYRAATAGLSQANAEIEAAKADLEKVAETIVQIAKAIDLVGKLAATV